MEVDGIWDATRRHECCFYEFIDYAPKSIREIFTSLFTYRRDCSNQVVLHVWFKDPPAVGAPTKALFCAQHWTAIGRRIVPPHHRHPTGPDCEMPMSTWALPANFCIVPDEHNPFAEIEEEVNTPELLIT